VDTRIENHVERKHLTLKFLDAFPVRLVIASFVLGFILFVLLISYAPDAVPFSPNNYGWNGLHQLSSQYSIHPISSIDDATASANLNTSAVLLIIGPVSGFTPSEAASALRFVNDGGTLVIADSDGVSNSLLAMMGASMRIQGNYAIYDSLYNWKGPSLPTAVITPQASTNFPLIVDRIRGVALNEPSPIVFVQGNGSSPIAIAITSPNAIEVPRSSAGNSLAFPLEATIPDKIASGPFTVAAGEKLGSGTLILIGDSETFTNSMLGIANNGVFASNLLLNSTTFLDTSHWPPNTSASLKAEFSSLYSSIAGSGLRYLFALGLIAASFLMLPMSSAFRASGEQTSKGHALPEREYDPKILEQIKKDREKSRPRLRGRGQSEGLD
jgi:hypothetical protein